MILFYVLVAKFSFNNKILTHDVTQARYSGHESHQPQKPHPKKGGRYEISMSDPHMDFAHINS